MLPIQSDAIHLEKRTKIRLGHALMIPGIGYINEFSWLLLQRKIILCKMLFASLLLCSCFVLASTSIAGQEDDFLMYPLADMRHPQIPYHQHIPFLHYYLSKFRRFIHLIWLLLSHVFYIGNVHRETIPGSQTTSKHFRRLHFNKWPNWNVHSQICLRLVWWPTWWFLS